MTSNSPSDDTSASPKERSGLFQGVGRARHAVSATLSNWITNASTMGAASSSIGAQRKDYLDGWRGCAIGIVLFSHFADFGGWMPFERVLFGRMGVDFFFVLSGLLMANILFVKRVPLKTFYKRRISRILPVFALYVSGVYAYAWFEGSFTETPNYGYTVSFLRSYFPAQPDIWRTDLPISHLWSLNVEEHAYIILSLITLIWVLRKREYFALFTLGLAAIAVHYFYVRNPHLASDRYAVRTEVAASHLMLSAGYFLVRHRIKPYVQNWMVLLALIAGVFSYSHYAPWYAHWVVSPFAFAFAVNHVERLPRFVLGLFRLRVMQVLGIWSYSIYLWQHPFQEMINDHSTDGMVIRLVYFVGAITAGLVSFYWIENPIRRFLNQRW